MVYDVERHSTEVSFPTIDRPQLRDLQYLITDGKSFFHEEKRDLAFEIERISDATLGYRCTNTDSAGRYAIVKDVIANPYLACLLQRTRIRARDAAFLDTLRMYVLCAPHLEVGGYGNTGYVKTVSGRRVLWREKDGPGWLWEQPFRSREPPVDSLVRAMAGPISTTTL